MFLDFGEFQNQGTMQTIIAQDPVKWDDVVIHDSDDDDLITGETSASLKISKGYRDPLGIIKDYIDPKNDEVDYSSSLFNPMQFLLEVHNSSLLRDLGKGLESMRSTVLDEESRLKKLVKDYFGDFVNARKTIEALEKTLSDPTYFDKKGYLLMDSSVGETVLLAESLIAPLQANREKISGLQTSLQLFKKYRLMFPTIDNVEEYLRNKQWDKLLKEYQKYKSTIVDSHETNIVIDMIKSHMMDYIQKAIDELLSILYSSSSVLTAEQQSHLITVVIGLDYPYVPELFMLQNSLQTWRNSITYCKEKLLNACELERINLKEVNSSSSKHVVVRLLLQYMVELSGRYSESIKKCKDSMMKRVSDLMNVSDSINEMMENIVMIMTLFQQQISWVFDICLNIHSMRTLLFTPSNILTLYDTVHLDMTASCETTFGSIRKTALKSGNTQLVTILSNIESIMVQKQEIGEMMIVDSYIKLSFYSINLAISGVEASKLLISPFVITNRLTPSQKTQSELPLLSFNKQITECCDGVVCHLHEYEQRVAPVVMKYYVEALQAIFKGINRSITDSDKVPLSILLQHIYTYSYIKSTLIEQPLTKYSFITKDTALKSVYSSLTSTINRFTHTYLQRNQVELIAILRSCFTIDWIGYNTLQPLRTQTTFFLTSLSLVSGDISLYVGVNPKKQLASLIEAAMKCLIEIMQGLRDISEQAYCQLQMEVAVMEKAIPSSHFNVIKSLLTKAYRGMDSVETQVVISNYVKEGSEKIKRILDTLN